MRLDETPAFSRVNVTAVGSLSASEKDSDLLGEAVIAWTGGEESDDVFAEVDVIGVLTSRSELRWLAGDTEVERIELPHYAGMPEDLALQARPVRSPKGDPMSEDWPPLIRCSYPLRQAVHGHYDYDASVEVLLCALAVAPDAGELRPMLLAGMKANYARVVRKDYAQPWRTQPRPSEGMLDVMRP
ncbi:hypothetical protein [Mycobacterium asiaticum]|uniref:Uncharacterized protein n=1 Tax=Mycobacterium asiaticum TaxID=1790 RepID=A0A1A3N0S2_MYCAS|nr:hypothetical protein [Mycobacterium asiaticum]OBK15743.1 hypothetical protein A5636_05220 [Mycobacterium asiaticum]